MKIAIVGPEESKWAEEQKAKAKSEIWNIFWKSGGIGYHYKETMHGEYLGLDTVWDFDKDLTFISGHCPKGGIDIWAEEIADNLGIKKEIFKPEVNSWNDYKNSTVVFNRDPMIQYTTLMGYRSRNIKIAEECDILYCIVPNVPSWNYYDNDLAIERVHGEFCRHCKILGHPTNGGCWTMRKAKELGKEVHLVVIE